MKMIVHQAIGMHLPPRLETDLTERTQKLLAIRIIVKNRLAPIAPAHHVVARPSILDP
jgi:hypothetical protein